MKMFKTAAIISLLTMLCAVNASAWGKKEQGILIGAAAALTLPHLLNNHRYDSSGYYNNNFRYSTDILYARPSAPTVVNKVIYVEKNGNDPMHRRAKFHNYIHDQQQPTRVIVEHADGTVTIIER
ncbi:MAG: hypothetical protein LBQ18_02930 [Campylobacteraceae bacterium]|jgi:hypothetical protein|nr:hypothetical protein [Campylobacteraceae bacterium]